MITIGHRGCAGFEPENTILGFKRAIEIGVDGIELDIRLTKDGQIVVLHDETLDRTTNMKGNICDYSYAEIKKADAGKSEKLPLLTDVFDLVENSKITVHIELKEPGLVEKLLNTVVQAKMTDRINIISFWHKELVKVKKNNLLIKTGALIVNNPVSAKSLLHDTFADQINIVYDMVDKSLIEETHKCKKKVYVWGNINNKRKIDKLVAMGVDGIASDFPDLLVNRIRESGKTLEIPV